MPVAWGFVAGIVVLWRTQGGRRDVGGAVVMGFDGNMS